jgi:hypothetical protein
MRDIGARALCVLFPASILTAACSTSGASDAPPGASSDGAAATPAPGAGAPDAATAAPDAPAAEAGALAEAGNDGGAAEAGATALLSGLSISTGTLVPSFDPSVFDYEVTSLNSLFPVAVAATACDCATGLWVRGNAATSGVPVSFTLAAGETFSVVVQSASGIGATYNVHYAPAELPAYSVSFADAGAAGTEPVLLTVGNYLMMISRSGDPLYYRSFAPQIVENFQQHILPSGEVAYSTLVGTSQSAWSLGVNHLMDAQLNDVGDVQLLANRSHGPLPSEGHDFLLLGDQHYVAESYVQRTVDLSDLNPNYSAEAPVINAVVQEVDHGTVAFEWDSGDVSSLYTDSVDGNAFTSSAVSDYLHLNAMTVDPTDQNFVFSLRHTNSIIKVDRTTSEILWTLGGAEDSFGLTPDQLFFHQHHAHFQGDGSLAVFDNGNNGSGQPTHQTRILSFVLDETNLKVTGFQVIYGKPDDQPQTSFMGAATQLGDTRYLLGWGGWSTGVIAPAVTEIVGGEPVWNLTLTSPGVFSYRALPVLGQ